jgi:mannose-1-phosphate guanylyltransferase/mannose-6-phosphate isomerase
MTEMREVTFGAPGRTGARVERPWGWFETLASGSGYQVKRLTVKPGKRLSLQWHRHRDEQWAVARGTARVTIGNKTLNLGRGQVAVVPRTVEHRIENLSSLETLEIVEVQTGEYLGEDDIVRIEDDFGRVAPAGANGA